MPAGYGAGKRQQRSRCDWYRSSTAINRIIYSMRMRIRVPVRLGLCGSTSDSRSAESCSVPLSLGRAFHAADFNAGDPNRIHEVDIASANVTVTVDQRVHRISFELYGLARGNKHQIRRIANRLKSDSGVVQAQCQQLANGSDPKMFLRTNSLGLLDSELFKALRDHGHQELIGLGFKQYRVRVVDD